MKYQKANKHYDYLEPKRFDTNRKVILWLGFSMVFIALQGFYTIPLQLPLIIGGNLIILCISYLELNKELLILTVLMMIAQISRIL
jgi:hypothetical protein